MTEQEKLRDMEREAFQRAIFTGIIQKELHDMRLEIEKLKTYCEKKQRLSNIKKILNKKKKTTKKRRKRG